MNFPGTATKDGTFTDELKDKESPEFKNLAEEFCAEASKSSNEEKKNSVKIQKMRKLLI